MNIQNNINKLLYALSQKEKIYKINSFKFYNAVKQKYSTKYQILKKEIIEILNEQCEIEYIEKYNNDYECYSKADILKYLVKEYTERSDAIE